ncbi:MAG: adenylate/guanylate cyclase domain-containing protein [Acidobacteria bacterium]|nr:MAG: adenylate/guanylate cyclase domain-containing protein [Acidobacteriota bacterium]
MRKLLTAAGIGFATAAVAALLGLLPFVRTIELKTYDWRMRLVADGASARSDIVLVAIDEPSIRSLEPAVGRWPWPRLVHAALLDFLARAPARAVVYDVLFAERDRHSLTIGGEQWTGEESDRALVEATARAGNVVHVVSAVGEASATEGGGGNSPAVETPYRGLDTVFETRPALAPPFPELAKASKAVGHNLLVLDPDGPVRRSVPFIRHAGQFVPSLAVAAAVLAGGLPPAGVRTEGRSLHVGPRAMPLLVEQLPSFYGERREGRRSLIRFPGGVLNAGKPTYADYSFYDLFYSEQQIAAGQRPTVDPSVFRDKVVFVGTTAAGLSDVFAVPVAGKMPGMQVHASVLDNLLSGRFMAPAPGWLGLVLVLACALAASVAIAWFGVWRGVGTASLLALLLTAAAVSLFTRGTWLRVTEPLLATAMAAFAAVAYQYLVEDREKRKVKGLFVRYVSKDVCDQLMADPARARLGGQRREMSVLFSDIRGFTTFSEGGTPEEVVGLLNEYFSRMVHVVFAHRGTLDKFIGDAVMALFGAPLDDPDHADHAVQAALDMLDELAGLNERWAAEGRPTLAIGIGVNSGDMVAGNIGSSSIMSYTVVGDAVNLGARLESLNKEYGTSIIVSEATRALLKGRYDIRGLGDVVVKGKTRSVAIYEVRAAAGRAAGEPA